MSTGMQYGLAIPHAKVDGVEALVVLVGLHPKGIPFVSLDGEPSHIFVLTLSPPSDANSHIRFLAEISRPLSSRRVREKLLGARSVSDLIAAVCLDPLPG